MFKWTNEGMATIREYDNESPTNPSVWCEIIERPDRDPNKPYMLMIEVGSVYCHTFRLTYYYPDNLGSIKAAQKKAEEISPVVKEAFQTANSSLKEI